MKARMLIALLGFTNIKLVFVVPPLGGKLTENNRLKPELQTIYYVQNL